MALYHLSIKAVSRSSGRSAVGAAAYRSGTRLTNERDGVTHDYTRRGGVLRDASFVVVPAGAEWARDRAALWNTAERAETRKNSTVAREYELALPAELDCEGRARLARVFAEAMVARFGVAADVALHAPGREGDQRNHHAHVLTTTRQAGPDGLGAKTRELDERGSGAVEEVRALWGDQVNQALERARCSERVDHRSHARQDQARGQDAPDRLLGPGTHLGSAAAAIERRATRERVRGLPEQASTIERWRATRPQPVSRRGLYAQERQDQHMGVQMARQAAREAESQQRDLMRAKAEQARKAPQRPVQARDPPVRSVEEAKPLRASQRASEAPYGWEASWWRAMPEADLREEVAKLRPPDVEAVLSRRPQVAAELAVQTAAETRARQAGEEHRRVSVEAGELDRGIADFRRASPILTWLHDKGLFKHPGLREHEQAVAAARGYAAEAEGREGLHRGEQAAAGERERAARVALRPGVQAELAPMRERHATAAAVLQERVEQRRAQERRQERQRGRDEGWER